MQFLAVVLFIYSLNEVGRVTEKDKRREENGELTGLVFL